MKVEITLYNIPGQCHWRQTEAAVDFIRENIGI